MTRGQIGGIAAWVAFVLAFGCMVLLSGCSSWLAGTKTAPTGVSFLDVEQAGPIQGLHAADGKDRMTADIGWEHETSIGCQANAPRPELCRQDKKRFWYRTQDSNGSAAQIATLQAQAQTNDKLASGLTETLNTFLPLAKAGAKAAGVPVP